MIEDLENLLGKEGISFKEEDLEVYSRDSSIFHQRPFAVARPGDKEDVHRLVKYACEKGISLIPRGAGTNPCGEVVGRAIIVDTSRMNTVLDVNPEDMYAVVGPGVVRDVLNKVLEPFGMFFPPDPASSRVATIGGMVSNNSSGPNSVRYKTTRDYVAEIEMVIPPGEILKTGTLALKSSSGYDLRRLLVGSEGTLGIFTRITLRLKPLPPYSQTQVFTLDGYEDIPIFQEEVIPLGPSGFEFIDETAFEAMSRRRGMSLQKKKALIAVRFSGKERDVEQRMGLIKQKFGARALSFPDFWDVRKGLVPLLQKELGKEPLPLTEDVGVPLKHLSMSIPKIKEIYGEAGGEVAIYGHIGDGNLHMRVFGELDESLMKAAAKVYEYVVSLGGTISSEHGIGRLRKEHMALQHGPALELMRGIKKALDPDNIMNPGCML